MSRINDILKAYLYNANKPISQMGNLATYEGENKQSGLKVSIKIIKRPDDNLFGYLQKLKHIHSEQVISIYELVYEIQTRQILMIHEQATYGTLQFALKKCKRLDDDDCITMIKILLNGHIEMLRSGLFWSGNLGDIQFTQNGMKMSCNFTNYIENHQNPFPAIFQKIGLRSNNNNILPFPKNKILAELIEVSRQNASEISLHPLLKKRDKLFKKKGKGWIALKEFKIKGQYLQELSYLAVSIQYGFVRVKIFDLGHINMDLVRIYQTKPAFVRILDYYEQGNSFITVSEYANDGTVQNYVKRLKADTILLKQSQIQFFFFSLIEPLKFIHKIEVGSLNMLHIKNIYIEDGIPKIGEFVPITQKLETILIERQDVPDFYHQEFKANPNTKNPKYDTYSLGVLLYKLMYTQYPIFPQSKVHIPTTPNYKRQLRYMLQLFLNIGGNLEDLEKDIEISDDVKLQVKQNQKLLQSSKSKIKKQFKSKIQISMGEQIIYEQQNQTWITRFWYWLITKGKDQGKYQNMYESSYRNYHRCTTVCVILWFYFLTFFIVYMSGFYHLISKTRLLTPIQLSINGQINKLIIVNYDNFRSNYDSYNNTSSLSILTDEMRCSIDNNGQYYELINALSPHWYIYLIFSFITMVIILTLKGLQLCSYSTVRVGYYYYTTQQSKENLSRFCISSYVYFQLWFAMSLYAFFYLFNFIYHPQFQPCFGGSQSWSALTISLLANRLQFSFKYLIIIIVVFAIALANFVHLYKLYGRFQYNKILNPIFIMTPLYLILFIMLRIGAYTSFAPSWINPMGILGHSYIDFIGYFPQLLIIVEIIFCLLIDHFFLVYMGDKISSFVNQKSTGEELQIDK